MLKEALSWSRLTDWLIRLAPFVSLQLSPQEGGRWGVWRGWRGINRQPEMGGGTVEEKNEEELREGGVSPSHLCVCWWSCRTWAWHRRPEGRQTTVFYSELSLSLSLSHHAAYCLTSALLKFCREAQQQMDRKREEGRGGGRGRAADERQVTKRRPRGQKQEDMLKNSTTSSRT